MAQDKYIPTIGIECHVQLKTETKLFSAVENDASMAKANSLISHIDAGLPGALPVLNKKALELACRAAFVLNTRPQSFSRFDRKHYFYPDLPKGYQITQYEQPIIADGFVEIFLDGSTEKVGINRVNLEEDAGKNIHPAGEDYSLVDLNRAGTPLLEIVSEPDIHSAAEAKAYVRELYLLMKYADISDCDLYLGHMRFDINTSVSKNNRLGTRSEVKNLNSFRAVEAAVSYEMNRQIELIEKGQKVFQETRGWDEAKQKTTAQRAKEEAHDYRYMPEPDVPPLELDDGLIKDVEGKVPKLPNYYRDLLKKSGLDSESTETILDYSGLVGRLVEVQRIDSSPATIKQVANWFVNTILAEELKRNSNINLDRSLASTETVLFPQGLVDLSALVREGKLSSTAARTLLTAYWTELIDISEKAKSMGLFQISDETELEKVVDQVVAENPDVIRDIQKGEQKAVGFLIGQIMQKTKGRANPSLATDILEKKLKN